MSTVGVAVLGVGYWGINHVRTFANLPNATLLWACDANPEALERVPRVAPKTKTCSTLATIVEDDEVDAVVIATPAITHADLAVQLLRAGKHVLVEKPLALNVEDAQRVADAAANADRVVLVGHLMLYHPAVQYLESIIASGDLGTPYYMQATRVNLGRVRTDENALWSLGPHDFSLIDHLFDGLPETISARGSCHLQSDIEDVVFANLQYADGRMANVHLSWLDPRKERRLIVVGSGKMIEFDDVSSDKLKIYDKGYDKPPGFTHFDQYLTIRHGDVHIPHVQMCEPLAEECRHFIACVQGAEEPRTGVASGCRVIAMLSAAQRSLQQNGAPVRLLK